jgi:hypothetical protein
MAVEMAGEMSASDSGGVYFGDDAFDAIPRIEFVPDDELSDECAPFRKGRQIRILESRTPNAHFENRTTQSVPLIELFRTTSSRMSASLSG